MLTFLVKRWMPNAIALHFLVQPFAYQFITNHVAESDSGATAARVLFFWNVLVCGLSFSGKRYAKDTNKADVHASYKGTCLLSILAMLVWAFGIMLSGPTYVHY